MALSKLVALGMLLSFVSSCGKTPDWTGVYVYDHSFGQSAVGMAMLVGYELNLHGEQCLLSLSGYQTYEQIKCKARPQGDKQLAIEFISYQDGSVRNAYGIEIYKPGSLLFELSEESAGLKTHWRALLPEQTLPATGQYFSKQLSTQKN